MTEAERILALSPRQPLNGQRVLRISGFAGRGEMPNSTQIQAVKVGSLNVGTMSGKGREVVDLMERRKLEVLCLQETRWRGNKARELGRGFKLFYSGADGRGRNGVGIILSPNHKENVISVWRKNDRIMLIKLIIGNTIINIMSVYAPQVGCDDEEKDKFWQDLDSMCTEIPDVETALIAGDFNGHVGERNLAIERVHGRYGSGAVNPNGERLIDFAVAYDLAILNTFFKKKDYNTYESGGQETQLDYILYKRSKMSEVRNFKVIKGETAAKQHHLIIGEFNIKRGRKGKKRAIPKIKWWNLKDEDQRSLFRERVLEQIELREGVEEWWNLNASMIRQAAEEILGMTSGKGPPNDKETWWWKEEISETIKQKKITRKEYYKNRNEENEERLKTANKAAKKAVAVAKAEAREEMYQELDTRGGQKKIYRIAKARDKSTKDQTHIRHMKDTEGNVLYDDDAIKRRWKEYFENLMNVENPRVETGAGLPTERRTDNISRREVEKALRLMKSNKAVGPDNIPIEAWKSLGEAAVDVLWDLLNEIYEQEKIPSEWRKSTIVPIYKQKGNIQDCTNYRGIKLISHTMKLWERTIGMRIEAETVISENQFGFVKGRQTSDAIFALRQTMEKYREKQKGLHMAFIDLEKAYDRVPRSEVWRCMREKGVSEKYVRLVQDMYRDVTSQVSSCVGITDEFNIKVGLHQGSTLSPYIFDLIMDVLSEGIREEAPWTMLFADDIVLVCNTKESLRDKLSQWKRALEDRGLKISRTKSEYLSFNDFEEENGVEMDDEIIKRVPAFKYLGSHVTEDGELDVEVNQRIQSGWQAWRRFSGVLCDKKISARLKGKVYKTAVRPAILYGSETWPIKRVHEKKVNVAEMRMLRWMCGVTRKDKIRNDYIKGTVKVTEVSAKMQERRINWYGHVIRSEEGYIGNQVMEMHVDGRRRRGRPKLSWRERLKEDLEDKGLRREDAMDRARWKRLARNSDPI